MDFVEQLKSSVDIVSVVGEYVRLRKIGRATATWGCARSTTRRRPPSRSTLVHQFYKCFSAAAPAATCSSSCMEIEGVSFYEALKALAERYGIPMPKRSQYADEESQAARSAASRCTNWRGELPRQPERRRRARRRAPIWRKRGVAPETIEHFGLGYSDRSGRALLRLFEQRGFSGRADGAIGPGAASGEDGSLYDHFRNRLMFPIHNESGKIIALRRARAVRRRQAQVSELAGNADL